MKLSVAGVQGVVQLRTEIVDRALKLGVTEQQLTCPEIASRHRFQAWFSRAPKQELGSTYDADD